MATYCCLNNLVNKATTIQSIEAVIKCILRCTEIPKHVEQMPIDSEESIHISVVYTDQLLADLWQLEIRWKNTRNIRILSMIWKKLLKDWEVQKHCDIERVVEWCGVVASYEQFIEIINMVKLSSSAYLIPLLGVRYNRWTLPQAMGLFQLIHESCVYMEVGHIDVLISTTLPAEYKLQIVRLAMMQCTKLLGTIAAIVLHRAQHVFFDKSMIELRKRVDHKSLVWLLQTCVTQQEALTNIRKLMGCRFKPTLTDVVWIILDNMKYYAIAKSLMLDYFCMPSDTVLKAHKNLKNQLGLQQAYI